MNFFFLNFRTIDGAYNLLYTIPYMVRGRTVICHVDISIKVCVNHMYSNLQGWEVITQLALSIQVFGKIYYGFSIKIIWRPTSFNFNEEKLKTTYDPQIRAQFCSILLQSKNCFVFTQYFNLFDPTLIRKDAQNSENFSKEKIF